MVFDDKKRMQFSTMNDAFHEHTNKVLGLKAVDNSTVLSSSWDCSYILWDLRSGSSVQKFFGPSATSRSLAVSPMNPMLFAAGSASFKENLALFDLRNTPRPIFFTGTAKDCHVNSLKWIQEDKLVVGTFNDNKIQIYSGAKGKALKLEAERMEEEPVLDLDYHEGRLLVVKGGKAVKVKLNDLAMEEPLLH